MATATKIPANYEVTLTLNRAEAEALAYITGSIGGVIGSSPRGHTEAIYNALKGAGVATSAQGHKFIGGAPEFMTYANAQR